ncbi:MAG: type I-F CRISPR-associated helicase Cas3f [Pseudomonadota bacterium]
MNILLVSQCSKNALTETRRIIDQFAERRGDRTWQTAITQQGLDTLRKMLKRTARRNTAVACHWIRGKDHSELLWVVGDMRCFNEQGATPTNITARDVLRTQDENDWHTAYDIGLLAGIAGLFHDFGKANVLFQKKLAGKAKKLSEPYRHEWVSLRLFQAFVGEQNDDMEWLTRLANIKAEEETVILERLIKDDRKFLSNPFKTLPSLAQAVGWLIVSHHRLPKFSGEKNEPRIDCMNEWMTGQRFTPAWNSPQCEYEDWDTAEYEQVWQFKLGTPFRSEQWCNKAQSVAKRALKHPHFFQNNWLQDRFSSHLARLVLMLADHCYSAGNAVEAWQDKQYKAYANTDHKTGNFKQKLDEHNVGVGHNAFLLAIGLPKLRQTLPSITRHKGFKQRSKNSAFSWQDKAYEMARSIREHTEKHGFFGVNMASTGCGKTFANARIMYGLANEKLGCRFNVALGLRTLTLQTGDALRERLHLQDDDLAILIGSQAVKQLHEYNKKETQQDKAKSEVPDAEELAGSESAAPLFKEYQYIKYDGSLDNGHLSKWLERSPTLHTLLSAPVLVTTIDHLIPATEGERGGKQIAPMLRLLTSDLVLDEPDDFDLNDLPALARLVNWAGMLGSRVLLSSATLPPALVEALFDAYTKGREAYQMARGEHGKKIEICCAWFDEFGTQQDNCSEREQFSKVHTKFVDTRIKNISTKKPLRYAELLPVKAASKEKREVLQAIAANIYQGIYKLHAAHHQIHKDSGKKVSIGLVRMANIKPMVATAQYVLSQAPHDNTRIHFCIYHSQHPLLVRSEMEKVLDAALARHDEEKLWQVPAIKKALECCHEENQIFVVFATSVAEVGRDHDYDWAIAEPSSMRSLIQLAGRIQRHRQKPPITPNIFILSKNYRALIGKQEAYTKPGFESEGFILESKNLEEILQIEQYQYLSAIPRISPRKSLTASTNLVDLEHVHLEAKMFGEEEGFIHASLWWENNPTWCAEMQRHQRFRASAKDEHFILYVENEGDDPEFRLVEESGQLSPVERRFERFDFEPAERVQSWMDNDAYILMGALVENLEIEWSEASFKFGEIRLIETKKKWQYHRWFGVYDLID